MRNYLLVGLLVLSIGTARAQNGRYAGVPDSYPFQQMQLVASLHADISIDSLALSPDRQLLAVGGDGQLEVFDSHSKQLFSTPATQKELSPESTGDAAAPNTVLGQREIGAKNHVQSLIFSPDGKLIAGILDNGPIGLWDSATGKLTHALYGHDKSTNCIVFSADSKQLVSGGDDKSIRLWDAASGKLQKEFPDNRYPIISVAFNSTATKIKGLSARHGFRINGEFDTDAEIEQWDLKTGEAEENIPIAQLNSNAATLDRTGQVVASLMVDKTRGLNLWDALTGEHTPARYHGGQVALGYAHQIIFSQDSRILANVNKWHPVNIPDETNKIEAWVTIWDIKSGMSLGVPTGDGAPVWGPRVVAIAMSFNGSIVAMAREGGTIQVWALPPH